MSLDQEPFKPQTSDGAESASHPLLEEQTHEQEAIHHSGSSTLPADMREGHPTGDFDNTSLAAPAEAGVLSADHLVDPATLPELMPPLDKTVIPPPEHRDDKHLSKADTTPAPWAPPTILEAVTTITTTPEAEDTASTTIAPVPELIATTPEDTVTTTPETSAPTEALATPTVIPPAPAIAPEAPIIPKPEIKQDAKKPKSKKNLLRNAAILVGAGAAAAVGGLVLRGGGEEGTENRPAATAAPNPTEPAEAPVANPTTPNPTVAPTTTEAQPTTTAATPEVVNMGGPIVVEALGLGGVTHEVTYDRITAESPADMLYQTLDLFAGYENFGNSENPELINALAVPEYQDNIIKAFADERANKDRAHDPATNDVTGSKEFGVFNMFEGDYVPVVQADGSVRFDFMEGAMVISCSGQIHDWNFDTAFERNEPGTMNALRIAQVWAPEYLVLSAPDENGARRVVDMQANLNAYPELRGTDCTG